ncbi:MAG: hypothetical protein F4004_08045, partial [Acidimicrobiia bacterium]|nr:hypothetical protein [Acidimicrobiia bacterium]
MRLRRREKTPRRAESRDGASSGAGGKRRERAKRARGQAQEEAWYRSVPPLFDEAIPDDFVGVSESPVDAPPEAGSITVEVEGPGPTDMMPPWAAGEQPIVAAPDTTPVWEAEAAAASEAAAAPEALAAEAEAVAAPDESFASDVSADADVPPEEAATAPEPEPEPEKVDIVGEPAEPAPSPATEPLAAPESEAPPDPDAADEAEPSPPDDPPMIIPIRAYYLTRTDDTLRSIAAQFLNSPTRWTELQSLNAAYPGIAAAGPDTLLPVGSSIALPGDPLPWGKPDPVYLWTLAEKFLYAAWGREPSPEEVVPFWRGLTGGAHLLESGPAPPQAIGVAPEPAAAPAAAQEAPLDTELPEPPVAAEPSVLEPEPEPAVDVEPVMAEAPAADEPLEPERAPEPPVAVEPPVYEPPAVAEPPVYEPPAVAQPPAYEPRVHTPPVVPEAPAAQAPPEPPVAFEPPVYEPPPVVAEPPAPPEPPPVVAEPPAPPEP